MSLSVKTILKSFGFIIAAKKGLYFVFAVKICIYFLINTYNYNRFVSMQYFFTRTLRKVQLMIYYLSIVYQICLASNMKLFYCSMFKFMTSNLNILIVVDNPHHRDALQ